MKPADFRRARNAGTSEETRDRSLRVRLIENTEALSALRGEWQRLHALHPRPEIFQHVAWSECLVAACHPRIFLLVAEDACGLRGLMPLARGENGRLHWLTAPRADYNDILCAPADAPAVTVAFLEVLRRCAGHEWRELVLEAVPAHALLLAGLDSPKPPPLRLHRENPSACHVVAFDAEGALARRLAKKKDVRANERLLARQGDIVFRDYRSPAERLTALPGLFSQHIARWRLMGDRSLFLEESACEFYRRLVTHPDLAGLVDFTALEVGGVPYACHFGFHGPRRFLYYKPIFDIDHQDTGAGTILLTRLITRSAESGCTEFDFTRGGELYKERFANGHHLNIDLRAFASPLAEAAWLTRRHLAVTHPVLATTLRTASRTVRALPRRGVALVREKARSFHSGHKELLVFSHEATEPPPAPPLPDGLSFTVGPVEVTALGQQVRWHPSFITAERLARCLERRKRGDWLARLLDQEGRLAHVSFIRIDEGAVELHDIAARHPLPGGGKAAVVFDCWTSGDWRGRGLYPWALRECIRVSSARGLSSWIYCRRSNTASSRGILKAGFKPADHGKKSD